MPEGSAGDERFCGNILMLRVLALTLTVLSAYPASGGSRSLVREGSYWVEIQSGTLPNAGLLRIRMRGPVTVRGGASVTKYVLRTRVPARTEAEARRLLRQLQWQSVSNRNGSSITLTSGQKPAAFAELSVAAVSLTPLSIDTYSGDLEIYDIRSSVHARTGAGSIQMDRIGGDVDARTSGGEIRMGRIGGGVRCFTGGGSIQVAHTGAESWFETAGGNVELGNVNGAVHATTAGGNIKLVRAGGQVVARSAGGRIEIQEARGAVVAGNSGGSIQVGQASGVRLEATGGSIRLRGSSGALRAACDVGSILAELIPGVRLQDSILSTGAGDITVLIPSNIALTIKALNDSDRIGRIVSEFPEILIRQMERQSRMLAEGSLNGGGPVLQLTSTGGTIYLRRLRQ
ncbi:MAG: hypothetical protein H7039_16145 [Bryobacteraceae bacterium]|nr:hypothetical protein [Bryobacteraceae bacterium]